MRCQPQRNKVSLQVVMKMSARTSSAVLVYCRVNIPSCKSQCVGGILHEIKLIVQTCIIMHKTTIENRYVNYSFNDMSENWCEQAELTFALENDAPLGTIFQRTIIVLTMKLKIFRAENCTYVKF